MRRLGAVLTAVGMLLVLGAVIFGVGRGFMGLIRTYDTLASPDGLDDADLNEDHSASLKSAVTALPIAAAGVVLIITGMVIRLVGRRRI